jgi:hypothetical protein
LPDFSWHNLPKRVKYTKYPLNLPNGGKIDPNSPKMYQHLILQDPPKFTQIGTSVLNIWQPCASNQICYLQAQLISFLRRHWLSAWTSLIVMEWNMSLKLVDRKIECCLNIFLRQKPVETYIDARRYLSR